MKKRLLSVLLVFCLVLALAPTAALADETAVVLAGDVDTKVGETIEIPVSLTSNPGIAAVMFDISYEEDMLTLKGIEKGEVFSSGTFDGRAEQKRVQWYDFTADTTANGVMFTLEFEAIGSGNTTVTVCLSNDEPTNFINLDGDSIPVEFTAGTVNIASDITNYTVTYVNGGGTGSMAPVTVTEGEVHTLLDCAFTAPDGKEFKAWQINGVEYAPGAAYTVNANTTVTAVWKDKTVPPSHTHDWLTEWNSSAAHHWHECGTSDCPITNNSDKDGYGEHNYDNAQDATCNVCGYIRTVTPVTYTITFDANGGTVSPTTSNTGTDGKIGSLPTPIREGYTFSGWYTAVNGGERVYVNKVYTANTTLYAHWTQNPPYTITFDACNGTTPTTFETDMDGKLTLADLPIPTRQGYTFEGWYTAASGGVLVTLDRAYTADATIYAHWSGGEDDAYIFVPSFSNGTIIPSIRHAEPGERVTLYAHPDDGYKLGRLAVKDIRGRNISLRSLGDHAYSFLMPDARVTVDAEFVKAETDTSVSTPVEDEPFTGLGTPGISGIVLNPATMPFTDVKGSDWFYNSVDYVWKHYLMSGVSDTQFAPNTATNRAMIWTILARMNNVRTDINPGSTWYEKGMLWAKEQGVTDGTNPMNDITREQLATMLWRNAGTPGGTGDLGQFGDSSSVSAYAATAMRWAVGNGIIHGENGSLNPQGSATRAQIAAMIQRYGERIGA